MQKHAVMRNMLLHFCLWKEYREDVVLSAAIKGTTPGDFTRSAWSRSVIFHEKEMEVSQRRNASKGE